MWQDLTFSIGQLFFLACNVYNIRHRKKPPALSAGVTAFWLLTFSIIFGTLDMWWSALTSALGSGSWAILCWQSGRQR